MKSRLSLPAALQDYLLAYRRRARKLNPHHVTPEVNLALEDAVRLLKEDTSIETHGQVLILLLYFGTTLKADAISQLSRHGIFEPNPDEMAVEFPLPDPKPQQVWIDDETIRVMRAYLERLPEEQERLFLADGGKPYSKNDIYQLVTGFHDEEEDALYAHFFPIYHESDYSVLPTPLRVNANTQYAGRGMTIAFIDSGFFPHPDLMMPRSRVRKYLNIAEPLVDDFEISSEDSWHGMQTSVSAAGNGYLSKGLYKGIAHQADVVLLKVRGRQGIQTRYIIEAIQWCLRYQQEYNIRVINISLSGDKPGSYLSSALDQAAEAAVQAGIVVVVSAGNAGWEDRSEGICPPASAPSVITVGGLNDNNQLDVDSYEMYWSSYGPTVDGILKPEIVAPGIWIAAPILPGSNLDREAGWLDRLERISDSELVDFVKKGRAEGLDWEESLESASVERIREVLNGRIKGQKLILPHYQHVDGTSFSAPIVCSVVAQMLEANPTLTPARIKNTLTTTTDKLYGIPLLRQGHGMIHPRKAVKEAANDLYRMGIKRPNSPYVKGRTATFYFRSSIAESVALAGDFNDWSSSAHPMNLIAPDLWSIRHTFEKPDSYAYKFVVDGKDWQVDPENLNRAPDHYGGENAWVVILN